MKRKGRESKGKRSCKLSKVTACTAVLIVAMAIVVMSLAVAPVMAQEDKVTVTVSAPEYVEKGQTFDVTIDVDNIEDFNTGLFDLCFDHNVVKVEDVEDGSIDDTAIPIDMWDNIDKDTIRVFFTVPETTGVSGSGHLAKISFKVKGDEGDESALEIENGFLGNTTAEEIVADWVGATIKIGKEEGEEVQEQPPDITAWAPTEKEVSSTEGESIIFEVAVDEEVDISWQINGTEVQVDEGVTKAEFTKSAEAGTWNVSVIVTSEKTGLSSMHTWIWSVAPTSTEASEGTPTPTPTLATGETPAPTPTLAPGETPKQAAKPVVKPTPKPTPTPGAAGKATPTPKTAVPGFEAVFIITAMSGIAYLLLRKRGEGR